MEVSALQKLKRGIHLDFHTLPGIYNFGEGFDAEIFAQRLQDAHVEIINAFFQCNIGHVYYPTKIGVPYPSMQGGYVRQYRKRYPDRTGLQKSRPTNRSVYETGLWSPSARFGTEPTGGGFHHEV